MGNIVITPKLGSSGGGVVVLAGDVIGPSNSNTLAQFISTVTTWQRLQIPYDTFPPTRGVFGSAADGTDPRSLLSYAAFGGAGQYRSVSIGGGVAPATLDRVGLGTTDLDTGDVADLTVEGAGSRVALSFATFAESATGEWTTYLTASGIQWRNHMGTIAGRDVTLRGYDAGDTATNQAGGAMYLRPGRGKGAATGAPLYLYAGLSSVTPGGADNGDILAMTIAENAVTVAVLEVLTGTSGPNNAGLQFGVGTESTAGNTTTYWGATGATAADSAHRGTYVQLRGGTGWPSDNVTAGGIGGSAQLRGGDGGAGAATRAAGAARHAIVSGGNAGADGGGGGNAGGDTQINGGLATGTGNAGGGIISSAGVGAGALGFGGTLTGQAGTGGVSASATASGQGGTASYRGGTGGAGTATAVGGNGGAATFAGGTGGAGSATTAAGTGGTVTVNAGAPGAAGGGTGAAGSGVTIVASSAVGTGNNAGGVVAISGGNASGNRVGGGVTIAAGTGGPTAGSGGTVVAQGGNGAAGTGVVAAGSGGLAELFGGGAGVAGAAGGGPGGTAWVAGGAGTGTQQGGNVQVNGGTGGSGGGLGGAVAILGGTGGAAGLAGGAVSVDGGTPGAGGLGGALTLGTSQAASVTIGRSGITTTINGLAQLANGPAATRPTGATVTTNENGFGNPGYGDLATVGPAVSVTLSAAATIVVTFSAIIYNATGAGFTGYVSVEASGATTIAASDTNGVFCASPGGSFTVPMARTLTLALNSGTTTLTLKYKRDNAGQDWHALNRSISVHP